MCALWWASVPRGTLSVGQSKALLVELCPLCQVSLLDHWLLLMGSLAWINQILHIGFYLLQGLPGVCLVAGECSTWNILCGWIKSIACGVVPLLPGFTPWSLTVLHGRFSLNQSNTSHWVLFAPGFPGVCLVVGECSTWNIGFKWLTNWELALIIDEIATNPPSVLCLLTERLIRLHLRCSQICFISSKQEFVVLKKRLYSKIAALNTKVGKHNNRGVSITRGW